MGILLKRADAPDDDSDSAAGGGDAAGLGLAAGFEAGGGLGERRLYLSGLYLSGVDALRLS